jgi:enediyne biosynthesis protein E4
MPRSLLSRPIQPTATLKWPSKVRFLSDAQTDVLMRIPFPLIVFLIPLLLFAACGEQRPSFVETGREAGLDFSHTSGAAGDYFLIETMGAGAAFIDYDGDGWQDIYLVNGFELLPWRQQLKAVNLVKEDEEGYWVLENFTPPLRYDGRVDSSLFLLRQEDGVLPRSNALYHNNGAGAFAAVAGPGTAGDTGYGMGCAVGDYDNDGRPDLYVTNYGANTLYHNTANHNTADQDTDAGPFADVTAMAGTGDPHWGSSAAFFDYDNDGDLDLYVANYLDLSPGNNRLCGGAVASAKSPQGRALRVPLAHRTYCSPRRYNGAPDVLYRNEGDGTFVDMTRASGVFSPFGKGLGVVAADFDADGHMDLFVANDGMRNFLYSNGGDATFTEKAVGAGNAYNGDGQPEAGMGVAAADYDGDSDIDLLVTNFSHESNTLYRNGGGNSFTDHSAVAGLHRASLLPLGFGTFFFDADNDADVDLFVANGHVSDKAALQDADLSYAQPDQLFANDGKGVFVDVSAVSGPAFEDSGVSRGAAYADYDNDGDLDVLVTNVDAAARLYRNDSSPDNNWLSLRLVGTDSNRDAVGARVQLWCGGRTQTQYRLGGGTYLAASDPRLHFGLGDCARIERLEVTWPDGSSQERLEVAAGQFVVIEQEEQ